MNVCVAINVYVVVEVCDVWVVGAVYVVYNVCVVIGVHDWVVINVHV